MPSRCGRGGAQRYTQAVLDDPRNQQRIEKWLAGNPDPARSTRNLGLEFTDPVGTSWSRGDSAPHDANNVMVTLRPVTGGHPPYVVLTSMPSDLPPPP
ncbi:RNase A-like domain-containing protein [Streptomyces sp. NPDC058375]|uniref:RNase A-like domain-containing protein n=1 Tax=Streptomyces sp. NPDC058375 TaxID=3346467 RepID=UPI00365CBA43